MEDCVFCKIFRHEAEANIIYQDSQAFAFWDQSPSAPVHLLIVPNRHIESINHLPQENEELVGHLFWVAKLLARQYHIADSGFRLVINTGKDAHQSVCHLHVHLMGGIDLPTPNYKISPGARK
jgi:histidine triad (HIT) family protein